MLVDRDGWVRWRGAAQCRESVEYHVRHLLGKLGARSRTEALRRARGQGLLPDR